ncbi:MAG TPA: hypothetical protein VNL15_05500 [Dehalococcoidia bacterium]|nr:hypothetical protein [Dehalococcoidia bacterium]
MIELGNEFAWVKVEKDEKGLSPRLRIENMRSGTVGYLDPLELEILSRLRHEDLKPLMDPGFEGWDKDGGLWDFLKKLDDRENQ